MIGRVLLTIAIVLTTLKLAGVIAWSWWVVTLPLWIIPFVFVVIIIVAAAYLYMLQTLMDM